MTQMKARFKQHILIMFILLVGVSQLTFAHHGPVHIKTQEVLDRYATKARKNLKPYFVKAKIQYPPKELVLVGIKDESTLELYARSHKDSRWTYIRAYPIKKQSGVLGPKLKRWDGQVPEGIYRITFLNPNSLYHLSLRVGYPNKFDRKMGAADGRKQLGEDIMIHGDQVSIGCLAMGDDAIEEIFTLVADTGMQNTTVILTPVDFRRKTVSDIPNYSKLPNWIDQLYNQIRTKLKTLPPT